MTRTSKWVGTVVVLLGVESSHAQQDIHSGGVGGLAHVTNAVEEGWLSQSGAQAVSALKKKAGLYAEKRPGTFKACPSWNARS